MSNVKPIICAINIVVDDKIYNGYDTNNFEPRTFPILYYAVNVTELYQSLLSKENDSLCNLLYNDVWETYNTFENYVKTYISMSYFDSVPKMYKSFTSNIQDIWDLDNLSQKSSLFENIIKYIIKLANCKDISELKSKLNNYEFNEKIKSSLCQNGLSKLNTCKILNIINNL